MSSLSFGDEEEPEVPHPNLLSEEEYNALPRALRSTPKLPKEKRGNDDEEENEDDDDGEEKEEELEGEPDAEQLELEQKRQGNPPVDWNEKRGIMFIAPAMTIEDAMKLDAARVASGKRPLRRTPKPAAGTESWRASLQSFYKDQGLIPAPSDYPLVATFTMHPSVGQKFVLSPAAIAAIQTACQAEQLTTSNATASR